MNTPFPFPDLPKLDSNWSLEARRLTLAAMPGSLESIVGFAEQYNLPASRLTSEFNRLPSSTAGEVVLCNEPAHFGFPASDGRKLYKAIIVPVRDLSGRHADLAAIIPELGSAHLLRGRVSMLGEQVLSNSQRLAPLRVFRCPVEYWCSGQNGIFIVNSGAAPLLKLACRAGLHLLVEDQEHKRELEDLLELQVPFRGHLRVRKPRRSRAWR